MTKQEKIKRLDELKRQANNLKKDVDYYNALQLALKLVLNGSYGAFATPYFVLFNNSVASTITAQGRDLTKTMDTVNEDYWYKEWHLDYELHKKLGIENVTQIPKNEPVSIYADTDSLFVSFLPAIEHSTWRDIVFNKFELESIDEPFIVLAQEICQFDNTNCLGKAETVDELKDLLTQPYQHIL